MWKRLFVVALIGWGAYSWWSSRPVPYSPGVAVPDAPVQSMVYNPAWFEYKGYRLTPLATFALEARVLSREDYRLGREVDLAKTDLVLGWGRMSDKTVLEKIDIGQGNRFYFWRTNEFPIPRREIEISSANMHLIPSNEEVASRISEIKVGQVVSFKGALVRVDAADGWRWISSLTREDTGAGACELVWVEEVSVL